MDYRISKKTLSALFILCIDGAVASTVKLPCSSIVTKCGEPAVQPTSHRIVGGTEARIGSWPWIVLLMDLNIEACGGAIINDRFILTAAHCFEGASKDPARWLAIAGKHHLDRIDSEQKNVKVKRIIMHEQFNNITEANDIALLQLEEPLTFSSLIQPICLPSSDNGVTTGQSCLMAGWGSTKGTANRMVLNQVVLPVIADSTCSRSDWYGFEFLPGITFCAGYAIGLKDACQGDSGGPFICKTGDTWYVQGISSWGYSCAEMNWPGIYTKVTKYTLWIEEKISLHSNCGVIG